MLPYNHTTTSALALQSYIKLISSYNVRSTECSTHKIQSPKYRATNPHIHQPSYTHTSCVANISHSTNGANAKKMPAPAAAPVCAATIVPVSVSRLCICIASATPMRPEASSRRSRLARKRIRCAAGLRTLWMKRLPLGVGGINGISGGVCDLVDFKCFPVYI